MENMSGILQVILSIAGVIVSIGIPLFIIIFQQFRADMTELKNDVRSLGDKIDAHISNYEIHKVGR